MRRCGNLEAPVVINSSVHLITISDVSVVTIS